MLRLILSLGLVLAFVTHGASQDMAAAAGKFIALLNKDQQQSALFPFDTEERYGFHYFPISDRKGLPLDEMNAQQEQAAMNLLRTTLNERTVQKLREIIQLETILKALENRKPDDHFRDPGKYYLAIFGIPGEKTIWGWRFEGHHVSFNFSANQNKMVSGTPGFLGSNPAVIQAGSRKGEETLKEEREKAFALLHSLSKEKRQKAIINSRAPSEIVTGNSRKAAIDGREGLSYSEMSAKEQQQLLQLIGLYVRRYTRLFADNMLKEIQEAGLNNLVFAWAGFEEAGLGKPHYYRIQGPTVIIEYDNTQNNANHVHTVVRDLKHDFGGDILLEHYRADHYQTSTTQNR